MVLFYEDEKKLKDAPTRLRRRMRIVFRTLLVFALLCGLSIGVLSMIGGSGDALRAGAEDYLKRVSGLDAAIGDFRGVTFFPAVSVSFGDVALTKRGEEEGGGEEVARLDSFDFAMGFWDVFFSRGRIRALELKGFHADAGVLAARAVDIERAGIDLSGETPGRARLSVAGAYGGESLFFSMDMDAHDIGGGLKDFRRPERSRLSLSLPFLKLEGDMSRTRAGGTKVDFSTIGTPEKIMEGNATLRHRKGGMNMVLTLKGGASAVAADIFLHGGRVSGSVTASLLDVADIPLYLKLRDALDAFFTVPHGIGFSGRLVDIDLEIKELKHGARALGGLKAPLRIAEETLTLAPVTGTLGGGELSGDVIISAAQDPAVLKIKGGLEGFPYGGAGQSTLSGKADIKWSLKSAASEWAVLPRNLKGDIVFVGGEGTMKSRSLDWWGGGIVNAMLPGFGADDSLIFNCAIADFKVNGGVARPDPLFIDTSRVTVAGEGEIDIPSRRADLKLTPEAKEFAVGTLAAVPVRVSGVLPDLSVKPDAAGLGAKLGTLFLGTINPAFWVFSLTELGLNENHPCYKFIAPPGKKNE